MIKYSESTDKWLRNMKRTEKFLRRAAPLLEKKGIIVWDLNKLRYGAFQVGKHHVGENCASDFFPEDSTRKMKKRLKEMCR